MSVSADDVRHDGRIHDAKPIQAEDVTARVNDYIRIVWRTHPAARAQMVRILRIAGQPVLQIGRRFDIGAGKHLFRSKFAPTPW